MQLRHRSVLISAFGISPFIDTGRAAGFRVGDGASSFTRGLGVGGALGLRSAHPHSSYRQAVNLGVGVLSLGATFYLCRTFSGARR